VFRSCVFVSVRKLKHDYPMEDAARIAFRTIIGYIGEHPEIKLVRYVLYDARAFETHKQVLEQMMAE